MVPPASGRNQEQTEKAGLGMAKTAARFVYVAAAWVVSGAGDVTPAAAQSVRFLPDVRLFEGPAADPFEPRLGIGLVSTNVFATQGPERGAFTRPLDTTEVQAVVAIGGTVPLFQLVDRPEGGIVVGAQAGVFGRFRVSLPSRDDLGQDWIVALPIEMRWRDFAARVRLTHRSAHLGDEFAASSGAHRIEFGGESVDALFAISIAEAVRVYGGAARIFHSNTDNTDVLRREDRLDRYTVQAGVDAVWSPWRDDGWSVFGGADYQSAERTRWAGFIAAAAGVRVRSGTRGVRMTARYLDGKSPLGQFFLTPERFWSIELAIDF